MKKILISTLLLISGGWLYAQDSLLIEYGKTITAQELKEHLSIIASDEYEGRETGTKGQKMAAEYILNAFKAADLSGPVKDNENPFFQPFELMKSSWGETFVQADGQKLTLFEDFFIYGSYSTKAKELEAVFAGYGLDDEKYSDYENLEDLTGKFAIIMLGQPQDDAGNYLLTGTDSPSEEDAHKTLARLRLAKEKGAEGVILVYEDHEEFKKRNALFSKYFERPQIGFEREEQENFGVFYTSPQNVATLLGIKQKKLDKKLAKARKKAESAAGQFSAPITVQAMRDKAPIITENVLGFMEGTDLKDEILVLTAHYDHIGKMGDQINNGADDDGSGTVTVLEIAEAFAQAKAAGHGPRRSILFMTVTGEEKGLLGSDYYSANPIFPLENTIANLNIDMVGRVDPKHEEAENPNYIYIIGSDMLSSELHQISEEVGKTYAPEVTLDYRYNAKDDPNRFYYRSDHYNFAKHGIPVIFYFNGTHADYHKPTDTVEKIHFEKMEKVARLIFSTAWELANRDQRPVVDKEPTEGR